MSNINLIRELTETLLTVAIILWAQVRNNPLIVCNEITPVTTYENMTMIIQACKLLIICIGSLLLQYDEMI